MFDCILINGDSYSAKDSNHGVYGDFLQEQLGVPVCNIAWPGSNNQRIIRSTLENLHHYKNPLVLIGWSFIRRLEVWYYGTNNIVLKKRMPDVDPRVNVAKQPRLITLNELTRENEATLEQKCLINDDSLVHKQLTDFYTNLYMFAHTLESMNIQYRFFSAGNNTDIAVNSFPYIESLRQVQWCINNKYFYRLHDFCISDWAKEHDTEADPVTGHLSENGHRKFTSFLLQQIIQKD